MQKKEKENQQTPLFAGSDVAPCAPTIRPSGMLREHNVLDISFALWPTRARASRSAGNVFLLCFYYHFSIKCNKVIERKGRASDGAGGRRRGDARP